MDGEGSFTVSYSPKFKAFISDVGFVQTNMVLPEMFYLIFGGSLRRKQRKGNPRSKPVWRWRIYGHQGITKFLRAILPYLKLKQRQALLTLEFHQLGRTHQTQRRHEIVEELHRLNKRGKSPETNMPNISYEEMMIESDLVGDHESAPTVT